jgi:hypothetical protein
MEATKADGRLEMCLENVRNRLVDIYAVFNLLAQKIRLQTCSFKEQIMVKNVR